MGYSTEFKGELKFANDLTGPQLAHLAGFFGEDCRDHPECGAPDLYYIDLELSPRYSGIVWDGSEKTSGMLEIVRLIIKEMRKVVPDFGLDGEFIAQGEDTEDRWVLVATGCHVERKELIISGPKVICPHCAGLVVVEEAKTA